MRCDLGLALGGWRGMAEAVIKTRGLAVLVVFLAVGVWGSLGLAWGSREGWGFPGQGAPRSPGPPPTSPPLPRASRSPPLPSLGPRESRVTTRRGGPLPLEAQEENRPPLWSSYSKWAIKAE